MSTDKEKKKLKHGLEGNIKVDWEVFFLDKFVLKKWISKKVSYFVGILCEIWDIFLPSCPQILSF